MARGKISKTAKKTALESSHSHSHNNHNDNEQTKEVQTSDECSCESCKRFWNRSFVERKKARVKSNSDSELEPVHKGDRVIVCGPSHHKKGDKSFPGVVQYVGSSDHYSPAPKLKVGVSLYDNAYTTHNGIYKGKRYFFCPQGHGAMVNYTDLQPIKPYPPTPPLTGNFMFPSYVEMKRTRTLRQKKIEEEEERLKEEHKLKRRQQMQRYSRSAPPLSQTNRLNPQKNHPLNEMENNSEHTAAAEKILFKKFKKIFGDDEKAERMALTLLKLYQGLEKGKQYVGTEY